MGCYGVYVVVVEQVCRWGGFELSRISEVAANQAQTLAVQTLAVNTLRDPLDVALGAQVD
jgi:hypothetical protein